MAWPGWADYIPPQRPRAVAPQPTLKRNKFNARTRCLDGVTFGSGKEAKRWLELRALEAAGEISQLTAHPVYELEANGIRIGRITPDASYVTKDGEMVIEDTKGGRVTATEAYRLRRKVFQALYWPLEIREV